MTILNQFWDFITGTNKEGPDAAPSVVPFDYSQLYDALYDLYNNDSAVITDDTTRRLRTVVNRSVEFYASKMLPGRKIEVIAMSGEDENGNEVENTALKEAIEQIIKDSNLGNNKPAMLRGFALYGDSFMRVRGDDKKSYIEDIEVFFVTDFKKDSRGFLTYIRIDVPILDENNHPALYTEYWDTTTKTQRIWETVLSKTTPIKDLGEPKETNTFAELGVTFIPIVYTPFRDTGSDRGRGCVYHALDKIYEANRIATRLHDLLFAFGEPVWVASANDKDAAGRPLPPPPINTPSTTTGATGGVVEAVKGLFGRLIALPGVSTLNSLIPNVDYADALAILNAQMEEIEKDLPELRWYSLTPDTQLSGTALRTLLGAAVDRANEARNNFISSLSRAIEMAITIGQFNGLFDKSLGTFDNGDFDHELVIDDSWGESTTEKGQTMATLTGAGVPAPIAMKLAGFSDEQVKEAFPQGLQPPPQASKTPLGATPRVVNGKQVLQVA